MTIVPYNPHRGVPTSTTTSTSTAAASCTTPLEHAIHEAQRDFYRSRMITNLKASPPLLGTSAMALEILKISELPSVADLRVLKFASDTGLRCHYEPRLRSIVPDADMVGANQKICELLKPQIESGFRSRFLPKHPDSDMWINSATTIDELLTDEAEGARSLRGMVLDLVAESGGHYSFGPGDRHITKSRESVESKVIRALRAGTPTEALAIQTVDDGVRGTLYFDSPRELGIGISNFVDKAFEAGWVFSISNLWIADFDCAGYADIDVKIKIPLTTAPDMPQRQIMAELQFHLKDFYDGSSHSMVARAHKVYEVLRMTPEDELSEVNVTYSDLKEASRLYFNVAMYNIRNDMRSTARRIQALKAPAPA